MANQQSIEQARRRLKLSFALQYEASTDIWTKDSSLRSALKQWDGLSSSDRNIVALDVGCGAGRDSSLLLRRGVRVIAVDLVRHRGIAALERRYPDSFRFYQGCFPELPSEQSFDLILDNGCFHHQIASERAAYLRRVRTLLRPGGCYLLTVFTCLDDARKISDNVDFGGRPVAFFGAAALKTLVQQTGLKQVRHYTTRAITEPLYYLTVHLTT